MGIKGAPGHVRKLGLLQTLSLVSLLLVAVTGGAAGIPAHSSDSSGSSGVAHLGAAMEAAVEAAAQQTALLNQLHCALQDDEDSPGFVVVIDLSHMVVPIDRAVQASRHSTAWAEHIERLVVRAAHRLLKAFNKAGASEIHTVLDCGQDALKNTATGRGYSYRNLGAMAGVRDTVKFFDEEQSGDELKAISNSLVTFTASPTSADQICARIGIDCLRKGLTVVHVGYDTDMLSCYGEGDDAYIVSMPFGPNPLAAAVRSVQPSAYWEKTGLSHPGQKALLAAVAGDDWSGRGIKGVGHAKMLTFFAANPGITTPKQLFLCQAFVEGVLGGNSPEQDVVDAVSCSYVRHLYVATATHDTDGWTTLTRLPDGLSVPTSRDASSPDQLCGWDSILPSPAGMQAGSAKACQHINTLVCAGLDAPFSERPQGETLRGILRGELHPATYEPLRTPEHLAGTKLATVLADEFDPLEAVVEARQGELDQQAQEFVRCMQQLVDQGETIGISPKFAEKLLPLLEAGGVVRLSTPASVASWLALNRGHPAVAGMLAQCGWESFFVVAAANFEALMEVLDSALAEAEGSNDPAVVELTLGLFALGSISDSPGYVVSESQSAMQALAARVAAQPGHRLQRHTPRQIAGIYHGRVSGLQRLSEVTAAAHKAVLWAVSDRVVALVEEYGDATAKHQGFNHPNCRPLYDAYLARRAAVVGAARAELLTAVSGALAELTPPQKAALITEPTELSQLPDLAVARLGGTLACRRLGLPVVVPAYMKGKGKEPGSYFALCLQRSADFKQSLHSMLVAAKQQGEAAVTEADSAALAAAQAEAERKAMGFHALAAVTARTQRAEFISLLRTAAEELPASERAALDHQPSSLGRLPDRVQAAVGVRSARTRLGLEEQAYPACIGNCRLPSNYFTNMVKQDPDAKQDLYRMLRAVQKEGEAALAAGSSGNSNAASGAATSSDHSTDGHAGCEDGISSSVASAAADSSDDDFFVPPAKRARRRRQG